MAATLPVKSTNVKHYSSFQQINFTPRLTQGNRFVVKNLYCHNVNSAEPDFIHCEIKELINIGWEIPKPDTDLIN